MSDEPTDLAGAVRAATMRLAEAGIESAPVDAVLLAAHLLDVGSGEVRRRMVLGSPVPAGYLDLVAERATRVPLQHLTGLAHFRRLSLQVGPGVFTPRPETETLVGLAVEALGRLDGHPVVVDLATGSAAIALAVKDEVPRAEVHAVELSPLAHGWAVANRDRLGLEVTIECGDALTAFESLSGAVDVVTCNPPYIPVGQVPIDPEVRDHDPALALYGGSADGLAVPLAMAARAARLLRPGGLLLIEHAESQGASLPRGLLESGAFDQVRDHPDLAGRPRVTAAVRNLD